MIAVVATTGSNRREIADLLKQEEQRSSIPSMFSIEDLG